MKKQVIAYLFVVLIAAYGAYASTKADSRAADAQKVARVIDRNGDLNLCRAENRIREKSNDRDRSLEATAVLVKKALGVLAKADRVTDPETNTKLRAIAKDARKIRTRFAPEPQSDCEARFEK